MKQYTTGGVDAAILAHYLEHAKPATAQDIAQRMGCSDSTVRNIIDRNHGSTPLADFTRIEVPTYSTNYPDMQHGWRMVNAWMPARRHMADIINRLLKQLEEDAA